MSEAPNQFGPWIVKQRPSGDWVVDQLDRSSMRVRRYGPFATEELAREVFAALTDAKEAA